MKLSLIPLAALFLIGAGKRDVFEERHGIGVLQVHEYSQHGIVTVSMFDSIGEGRPHSRWIELDSRSEWFWMRWKELLPFQVFNGSGEPLLVCMEVKGEWFRVRLKGGVDYWVRQEDRAYTSFGVEKPYKKFELQTWASFMSEKAWIGRLDDAKNPIHTRPNARSGVIPYSHGDCMKPVSARGWWVEVEPHNGEGCITDTTMDESLFKKLYFDHGWVQWRNDSAFLLRTSPYN